MNPLTTVRLISKLNEWEAETSVPAKASWHSVYKDSAWIFVGGLPCELTEGDILCVFSQYGEIVNINLVRDRKSGKSKGFCFICYENQRSTILAVDNFNGIKIRGRTIRVDHVSNYRPPPVLEDVDGATEELWEQGCGAQTPSSSSESCDDEALYQQQRRGKRSRNKIKGKAVRVKDEQGPTELPSSRGQIKRKDTLPKHTKVRLDSREGQKP
ncbi:RNA-binding motif protein, X-linked 2-like [Manis pentadactyla]|uniref:RNA-binding motif protein, X-linked 2-like n=1 Tax=Manis pentadactyla TaxID=143292 RepID=UPI00255C7489|nr:RNA-binding motif protein, X-linked 2-like [Manis pentadactyla]